MSAEFPYVALSGVVRHKTSEVGGGFVQRCCYMCALTHSALLQAGSSRNQVGIFIVQRELELELE